jgi:polar amino acid transport system substrate-binding protein
MGQNRRAKEASALKEAESLKEIAFALLITLSLLGSAGAEPAIPNLWDARERMAKPDLSDRPRLRFLTTIDFPPFNVLDEGGKLTGFHIDLARAICAEIGMTAKCQIQGLPWSELDTALEEGQGEAILAGIAITAETRQQYAFSRPYLYLPGRFVTSKASQLSEPIYEKVAGMRVGVVAGSAHERALRDLFPEVRVVTYSRPDWVLGDLRDGKTDAVFGDGMRLSFWLTGAESKACCRFAGGPYLLPSYFGRGMAIAARPDDRELVSAFDYALREISAKGRFAELYLRYFPVSFF